MNPATAPSRSPAPPVPGTLPASAPAAPDRATAPTAGSGAEAPPDPPSPLDTAAQADLDLTPRAWWRRPGAWLALLAAILLAGAGASWYLAQRHAAAEVAWRTEPVVRGDLALTVTANGTLQPTRTVNIGSELSGTVARVLADVNDPVRAGQVLLELDRAKLADQVARARAALQAAEAALAQAVATRAEAAASLARLEEVRRLSNGKVPSAAELDTARAALARAEAGERNARAGVDSARAALSTDSTNLAKAAIRSPIAGVVLARNVDPGNAVAASLQAVTLFTLAEDLHHLRLLVNVDEADVGQVRPGQGARFTVSAYPSRQYPATITRVAYGSTITDNVVTYVSYLDVDNPDLSLRPGMTATAVIGAAERHGVLLVPNSALRFDPRTAPGQPAAGGVVGRLLPRMPPPAQRSARPSGAARQVWVLRAGVPAAVPVQTGLSDGVRTEIVAGALQPGMRVITEQLAGAAP